MLKTAAAAPAAPARSTPATASAASPGIGTVALDDLEFASLIASKICHDAIGPVQAIALSLEVLDDQDDTESRDYAMSVIRNSTEIASAKLEFARMAFGAAGSAGAAIDMATAHKLAKGFAGKNNKHRLDWSVPAGHMPKDRAKLLLNMVAGAVSALPHGGDITVDMTGTLDAPSFTVRCSGQSARVPAALQLHLTATEAVKVDAQTVQAYYASRIARSAGMTFTIAADGPDVVLKASPAR